MSPRVLASQLEVTRGVVLTELAAVEAELEQARLETERVRVELETLRATRGVRVLRLLTAPKSGWRDWLALPAAVLAALRSPAVSPAAPAAAVASATPAQVASKPPAAAAGPSGYLRIAAIVDGFTAQGLAPDCQLCLLAPDRALSQLEEFRPDLLLVESAWEGHEGQWRGKMIPPRTALLEVLAWCGREKVPSVFWNKEDPPHFEHFLPLAGHFDWIYTTAVECVPDYRDRLRRDAVGVLPFACQPVLHNPIQAGDRRAACSFAGSYYAAYPERGVAFGSLVEQVSAHMPVDIYDRKHGSSDPAFAFPEPFRALVVGGLPGDRVDEAYKGYRFAINLNTITASPTMFARRVFELLACNTVTISNPALGMQRLFGDLVLVDGPGLDAQLAALCADPVYYRKLRLAGLRKVMSGHTWRHRLELLAGQVLGRRLPDVASPVTVVARAGTASEVADILAAFERQAHASRRLVVVADPMLRPAGGLPPATTWLSPEEAGLLRPAEAFAGSVVATFLADDYYGPHYLSDLALGFLYAGTDAVGKAAHYRWQDRQPRRVGEGDPYRSSVDLPVRASLLRAERVAGDLAGWLDTAGEARCPGMALDEFGYCRDGAHQDVAATVDDLPGLDVGLDLGAFVAGDTPVSPEKPE